MDKMGKVPKSLKPRHFLFMRLDYRTVNNVLSYDVAVFCNKKCYDHTCINTFAGTCNVIDNVRNNNVNLTGNMSTLKVIKSCFRSHMIEQILHSWCKILYIIYGNLQGYSDFKIS